MKKAELLAAMTACEKVKTILGESSVNPILSGAIMATSALGSLLLMHLNNFVRAERENDEDAAAQMALFEELEGTAVSAAKVRNIILAAMKMDGEDIREELSPFALGQRSFLDGMTLDECPHREDTPEAAQWVCGFEFARPRMAGAKQARQMTIVPPAEIEQEEPGEDEDQTAFGLTTPRAKPGADVAVEVLAAALATALAEGESQLVVTEAELETLPAELRLELYEWANGAHGHFMLPEALRAIEWAQAIELAIQSDPGAFEQVSSATSVSALKAWPVDQIAAIGSAFARGEVPPGSIETLLDALWDETNLPDVEDSDDFGDDSESADIENPDQPESEADIEDPDDPRPID
jgi:hypothetical protein